MVRLTAVPLLLLRFMGLTKSVSLLADADPNMSVPRILDTEVPQVSAPPLLRLTVKVPPLAANPPPRLDHCTDVLPLPIDRVNDARSEEHTSELQSRGH